MAWEHRLAKQFKFRDNPRREPYLIGTVVSASPLKISIYGGEAFLEEARLRRADPYLRCGAKEACSPAKTGCTGCGDGCCLEPRPLEVGQRVALVGEQTYLILGVVP